MSDNELISQDDNETTSKSFKYDKESLVSDYFNRTYCYESIKNCIQENCILNVAEKWKLDELYQIKEQLNHSKNKLSSLDIKVWHSHTQFTHKASDIISTVKTNFQPQLCTQAWCKFREILCKFPQLVDLNEEKFNSFHLCEAPGAFVASLNFYLHNKGFKNIWNWKASTLNPMNEGNNVNEMINSDYFIQATIDNWCFGWDDTGDIINVKNIESFKDVSRESGMTNIHLVTCDGSIDCANTPSSQEEVLYALQYAEVLTALSLLSERGNLVLKVFTMFESSSVCLLYLIACHFQQLTVFKPATSKPGNSEVYIIATHFLGVSSHLLKKMKEHLGSSRMQSEVLFSRDDIPDSFLQEHIRCVERLANWQCNTITTNLTSFLQPRITNIINPNHVNTSNDSELTDVKNAFSSYFLSFCDIKKIKEDEKMISQVFAKRHDKIRTCMNVCMTRHEGSLLQRRSQIDTPITLKLMMMSFFTDVYVVSRIKHTPLQQGSQIIQLLYGKSLSAVKSSKLSQNSLMSLYLQVLTCPTLVSNKGKMDSSRFEMFEKEILCYVFDRHSFECIVTSRKVESLLQLSPLQLTKITSNEVECDSKDCPTSKYTYIHLSSSKSTSRKRNSAGNLYIFEDCFDSIESSEMQNILYLDHITLLLFINQLLGIESRMCVLARIPVLMTRLSCQLLRILTACFEMISVHLSPSLPLLYVFCDNNLIQQCHLRNLIMELKEQLTAGNHQELSLMSFLPYSIIYDEIIFEKFSSINNSYIKTRINNFISFIK